MFEDPSGLLDHNLWDVCQPRNLKKQLFIVTSDGKGVIVVVETSEWFVGTIDWFVGKS